MIRREKKSVPKTDTLPVGVSSSLSNRFQSKASPRKQPGIRKQSKDRSLLLNIFILLIIAVFACVYFVALSAHQNRTGVRTMASAHSANRIIAAKKPFIVYGTAWKEENTAKYVTQAVRAGFRFIDTACQPKHYFEAGVGDGWTEAAEELGLQRSDLYIQTKFSPGAGNDPNPPYDPTLALEVQVTQSLNASLSNLKTTFLDSLVLHSPLRTLEDTMTVWRTMEGFVDDGQVLRLGVSNCYDYRTFTTLYEMSRIKPSVLQNRFYAESKFDTELREFCKTNGIWYQSFWTLTGNRHALASPEVVQLAKNKGLSPQTLMFAFLMQLGYVTPLSGTTSLQHMQEDVSVMKRMQAGEKFFDSDEEMRGFAKLLGMPGL